MAVSPIAEGGGSTELAIRQEPRFPLVPASVVDQSEHFAMVAAQARAVIESEGLSYSLDKRDRSKKFVGVEGWTLLAARVGVSTYIDETMCTQITTPTGKHGWMVRAEARAFDGSVLATAVQMADMGETGRDTMAKCLGMAQTRALSRVLRHTALSAIMKMAGYEATPADEYSDRPARPAAQAAVTEPAQPTKADEVNDIVGKLPKPQFDFIVGKFGKIGPLVEALGDRKPTVAAILEVAGWTEPAVDPDGERLARDIFGGQS